VSYISNYMMAISDLGDTLIMHGLVTRGIFSKRSKCFMKSMMFLLVILLPSACK